MAIQSFQIDPNHQHAYYKLTEIGCDSEWPPTTQTWVDVQNGVRTGVAENGNTLVGVGVNIEYRLTTPPV